MSSQVQREYSARSPGRRASRTILSRAGCAFPSLGSRAGRAFPSLGSRAGRAFLSLGSRAGTAFLVVAVAAALLGGCKRKGAESPRNLSPGKERPAKVSPIPKPGPAEHKKKAHPRVAPKTAASAILGARAPSGRWRGIGKIAPARRLPAKTAPRIRKIGAGWFKVTLDISKQVLRIDIPEDRSQGSGFGRVEAPIHARLSTARRWGGFTSAAFLGLKAKQFDDGLYAAVELAADLGHGTYPSMTWLLARLLQVLLTAKELAGGKDGSALIAAAARLAGVSAKLPPDTSQRAKLKVTQFIGDEKASKPLGFYTWSEALRGIFRRDRLLQGKLKAETAAALAKSLAKDKRLIQAYSAAMELREGLTNPLVGPDLRPALRGGALPGGAKFIPPSRSHETELIKKMFGARPIPKGFNLADEMVKRIRAGTLSLAPTPASGWYDHQVYALEPLVIPHKMAEAQHVLFSESYKKELVGLFKSLLALTRETHVKQLERPTVGSAAPGRLRVTVRPGLSLEPLASYYLRRALSYRFVRLLLHRAFGAAALAKMHRQTAQGPVATSLARELRWMEGLFHGAYLKTATEIGLTPVWYEGLGSAGGPSRDVKLYLKWIGTLDRDRDVGQDVRMMVPLFYDAMRRKTKVWAVLGLSKKRLEVGYEKTPTVKSVRDMKTGRPTDSSRLHINYKSETHSLIYLVSAEVYVSKLLNREEFRKHCDRYKTQSAILKNLK